VPSVSPKQSRATSAEGVKVNTGGAVMLIVAFATQPLASVTCTLIDPTPPPVKFSAVAVVEVVAPVVFPVTRKV
jgi:hypothetical protein